jgi:hypothetical protein
LPREHCPEVRLISVQRMRVPCGGDGRGKGTGEPFGMPWGSLCPVDVEESTGCG